MTKPFFGSKKIINIFTRLFLLGIAGVLIYGIYSFLIFIATMYNLFRDTTGYNPIYFFGTIILIGLFVGNNGAIHEIILNLVQNIKNKQLEKE
jgi:hypothetical protein